PEPSRERDARRPARQPGGVCCDSSEFGWARCANHGVSEGLGCWPSRIDREAEGAVDGRWIAELGRCFCGATELRERRALGALNAVEIHPGEVAGPDRRVGDCQNETHGDPIVDAVLIDVAIGGDKQTRETGEICCAEEGLWTGA